MYYKNVVCVSVYIFIKGCRDSAIYNNLYKTRIMACTAYLVVCNITIIVYFLYTFIYFVLFFKQKDKNK